MKSVEHCLDIILEHLYENWNMEGGGRRFLEVEKILDQFDLPERWQKHEFFKALIHILVKDEYAEYLPSADAHRPPTIDFYIIRTAITVKGYAFYKIEGGYVQSVKKAKRKDLLQSVQTWAIVLGTVAAGIYGLKELFT